MVVADDGRASAVWLQELRDDSERMERDLGPGAKHRARLTGRSLRRCKRFEFHTDAVEPAPFCDATPTMAIYLQIELFRKTVSVVDK
jgi:hypothetical protein